MLTVPPGARFVLNGCEVQVSAPPASRLSAVLRDELGLIGTKVGCDAGDCGACTILLDREPVCGCMVALGQVEARDVVTIEGLAGASPVTERLRQAFLAHGAAQCGFCTPGMLVAATALLRRRADPSEQDVLDALGGVLCRCTGYRKIVAAILSLGAPSVPLAPPAAGAAVGARLPRLDGAAKVEGREDIRRRRAPGRHACAAGHPLAASPRDVRARRP